MKYHDIELGLDIHVIQLYWAVTINNYHAFINGEIRFLLKNYKKIYIYKNKIGDITFILYMYHIFFLYNFSSIDRD